MGRSKKSRGVEEILKSMNESADEPTRPEVDVSTLKANSADLEEMDEPADDVELDEADESDPEETTELDLSGKPRSRRKQAPKKRASSRKSRKEPRLTSDEVTEVLETREPEAEVTEVIPPPTPKAPKEAAKSQQPDHLREDVSIASASLHKTMDVMVKQWSSVKEISGSICQELERVNTMLKTPVAQPEPADLKEYLRQAAPRITFANKIALGVSAAAVVLSVLSLSLASSTRNTVLEQTALPRIAWQRPTTPAPAPVVPPVRIEKPAPEVVAKPVVKAEPVKPAPTPLVVKHETPTLKRPEPLLAPKPRKELARASRQRSAARLARSHRW